MNGGIALMGMVLCGGAVAAPEGFEVGVYSDRVQNATAICFDDQGRLYVTETFRWRKGVEDNRDHTYWIMDDLATETNEARVAYYTEVANERFGDPEYFTRESERVVVMADVDGDGKAEVPTVFAEGFSEAEDGPAIGLLAGEGRILMACVPHVWDLKDADGDGVSEAREKLASGFGVKTSLSGHDLHGLVWGPDGKLYFSMGDRGYNVTTKEGKVLKNTNSGAAFRCDPDGSNLEIFYHNLRNPQEMAFNELGDLITVDNNCDQGDSARVCYLIEGGDAGWNLGAQALTTYSDFIEDGGMEQRPHWLEEGLWKTRHANQPAWVMPPVAHLTNGPSGMLFDSGTSMPERYKNHFLVCDYKGAPNVCFLYSFKLVHAGAGYAMDDGHVFHSGVPNTDVEMGYDGKVYLADFGGGWVRTDAGNIYTVYDPERVKSEVVTGTVALFKSGFDQRAPSELLDLLGHADKRVRQRAQFALVKHGEKARRALASLAARDGELYPRLHAIWGLQQLGAGSDLVALSGDENGEIRAQAVRSIGEIGYAPAKARVRELIGDVVPRVRTFAAMASGKLGDREAMGAVAGLLEKNNNADLYERHAGVFALERLLRDTDLADFKEAVPAVKLGVLLALRRQANPLVAEFL
ncbi:MAG: HEAT repeat domain-containing protein, partial [Verrucomicrobiales bacterium]|nr:HEAT repeat domain-containing protein [Verrucomicrobiales bacterium]